MVRPRDSTAMQQGPLPLPPPGGPTWYVDDNLFSPPVSDVSCQGAERDTKCRHISHQRPIM